VLNQDESSSSSSITATQSKSTKTAAIIAAAAAATGKSQAPSATKPSKTTRSFENVESSDLSYSFLNERYFVRKIRWLCYNRGRSKTLSVKETNDFQRALA